MPSSKNSGQQAPIKEENEDNDADNMAHNQKKYPTQAQLIEISSNNSIKESSNYLMGSQKQQQQYNLYGSRDGSANQQQQALMQQQ